MNRFKRKIRWVAETATLVSAVVILFSGKIVMAVTAVEQGAEAARADGMPKDLLGDNGVVNRVTNLALGVVGLIAVIMLIFGGLRYITSGGDAKKVTDAKNTVLYAIIGLVICVLAYAIVNFVLSTIGVATS